MQQGLEPTDWKPIQTVGPGVHEIRIQTGRQFRVLYVAKFPEAVYVLHAFEKKSQRTASRDLQLAKIRYAEMIRRRRRKS